MTAPNTTRSAAIPVVWTDLQVCIAHCEMAPLLAPEIEGTPGLHLHVSDQIEMEAADPDVLIGYHFPPGSLANLRRLRWIHLTGTGTEHLAAAELPPGVLVTTSAAVPVTAVAEYALAGMLLLLKDLPELIGRRDAAWYRSGAVLLSGSTVAVVGTGRIGRAVLTRVGSLGAHTVAVTHGEGVVVPEAERVVPAVRLAAEASSFDHLIVCLPGGATTRGLVGAEVLAALPPHAVVVNIGRGETVDNAALHMALRAGLLRGAFVDVHEREPLAVDDPVRDVPRLVVSPHRAFAFPDEPIEVARTFLDNLHDLRRGLTPRDIWHAG